MKCDNGHEFTKKSSHLMSINKINCVFCSGHKLSKKEDSLEIKFPKIALELSNKNSQKAFEIPYNSNKKYIWKCNHNHEWKSSASSRTGTRYSDKKKSGCPFCRNNQKSDPELIIFSEISYFFESINGYKHKNKELDIFIPDLNIGIEYDGFRWHSKKIQKDIDKNNFYKENGIEVLRIREDPLNKINSFDYIYDNKKDGIIEPIIYILSYILEKKKLESKLIKKIELYIKNKKIKNEKHYNQIKVNYSEKNIITRKALFNFYSSKNSTPLNYYKKGSDKNVHWECPSCNESWELKVSSMVKRNTLCSCCGFSDDKNNKKRKDFIISLEKYYSIENEKPLSYYKSNSRQSLHWNCPKCDHKFEDSLFNTSRRKKPCKKC
jgi:hypothetical protein